jgi:dTDP-4-amino-4,6-dideoxygalactose transaminase
MMQPIPQSSPKAGYLAHRKEIDAAIRRVLDSGWYILGPEVAGFEREFAAYLGASYALGVASGTDALQLALRAVGVGPGDAVLTVSHTATATVAAIELIGALPIFVDIEPRFFTMEPNALEETLRERDRTLQPRPKAVVPVHLYGHPCDMTAIMEIADRYDLRVVEDCAQSHGARWRGRMTGTWGHAAAFSFYPTKNLGALGDGGAVITNDSAVAERIRMLREYGWRERYISAIPGDNSRLDEIQAAILRAKLPYLDRDNARRIQIAREYDDALHDLSDLMLPQTNTEAEHVFHQYVVRTRKRDALQTYLRERGIGTLIHYPVPIHKQPAYARYTGEKPLTDTDAAADAVLSLPLYPELTDAAVSTITQTIQTWAAS